MILVSEREAAKGISSRPSPATAFVMVQPDFVFEFLEVPVDSSADLRQLLANSPSLRLKLLWLAHTSIRVASTVKCSGERQISAVGLSPYLSEQRVGNLGSQQLLAVKSPGTFSEQRLVKRCGTAIFSNRRWNFGHPRFKCFHRNRPAFQFECSLPSLAIPDRWQLRVQARAERI